jgi:hypothetical protein
MMSRFLLQNGTRPGWWVLTDTVNQVVLQFKEHDYNNSQKVTFLKGDKVPSVMYAPRILREMGDYMVENHKKLL